MEQKQRLWILTVLLITIPVVAIAPAGADAVNPPAGVTGLHNTTYENSYITWNWTDPLDADFSHVMVYFNDTFAANVTGGTQSFNATFLLPDTSYNIGTQTVDTFGNINTTWVNRTRKTAGPDSVPPASITNLSALNITTDSINTTWTDPGNPDFSHVMVYLDSVFTANVTRGTEWCNVTGLSPGTTYRISTHTVDTSGNVNGTWVNRTRTTSDVIPPAGITALTNTTYKPYSVNWTWTDPADADFSHVMIYLDDTFMTNVSKGIVHYNATSLNPSTGYTIGTQTVDYSGNVNTTWVNTTTVTAP
jgi:hypothetical protein